jgi:hypothetical protein
MTIPVQVRALLRAVARIVCGHARAVLSGVSRVVQPLLFIPWALGLSLIPNTASATPDTGAYFAEPGSGRRVSSYSVELAVSRGERQPFEVPRDCGAITRSLADGTASSARVIDRRLWRKAADDCWFYTFLHRHSAGAITDYVSDYDFMNARLSDLPIDQDCVMVPPGRLIHESHRAVDDEHGVLKSFPIGPRHPDVSPGPDSAGERVNPECALRDGLFYGQLFVRQREIRCTTGNGTPSLRLIAVDYADINGDRIMDAVLRFVPVGPGAARSPLILPVTRLGPDEVFSVPDFDSGPPR